MGAGKPKSLKCWIVLKTVTNHLLCACHRFRFMPYRGYTVERSKKGPSLNYSWAERALVLFNVAVSIYASSGIHHCKCEEI